MAVMRKTVSATAAVLAVGVAVALPAHATTADQPQGFITNADAPGTIDDSYIVTLEDATFSAASAAAENLADTYDAEIVTTYEHALNGYEIEATEAEALALADNPGATPAQVWSALDSASVTGQVGSPGTGSPNKLLQVP